MNKIKRCIALLLCIFIVLFPAFSEMFLASNVNHECSGEECHICFEMHVVATIINTFDNTLVKKIATMTLFVSVFCVTVGLISDRIEDTLISLKVELLN